MAMYAIQFAATRREEAPREDLTTLLLETDFNGTYMTDIDFGSFFVQLVTAGNDTTKTMLSSGLLRAARPPRPARRAAGRSHARSRARSRRSCATRTRCTTSAAPPPPTPMLRGVEIAAGDKVVMFYTSANRDEDVFDDPQRFDIRRTPNPHLSFGIAEHFCLGVHLARLEGRVFFEELLATFPTIELTGEPVRIRSNLNNALKSLPVRFALVRPQRVTQRRSIRTRPTTSSGTELRATVTRGIRNDNAVPNATIDGAEEHRGACTGRDRGR